MAKNGLNDWKRRHCEKIKKNLQIQK